MPQLKSIYIVLTAIAFVTAIGCKKKEAAPAEEAAVVEEKVEMAAEEPLKPLPELGELNMKKVALGRKLFHDPILSGDGTISCSTCHTLDHGGAEPRKTSTGIRGQVGPINSPTVLNSSLNFVQFWDGRAKDLREQAEGPVANPIEMGATWDGVVKRLKASDEYATEFASLYEDGVTKNNVTDAIAVYEEALITPSRFDRYLRGDENAITEAEKRATRLSRRSAVRRVTTECWSAVACFKRWAFCRTTSKTAGPRLPKPTWDVSTLVRTPRRSISSKCRPFATSS